MTATMETYNRFNYAPKEADDCTLAMCERCEKRVEKEDLRWDVDGMHMCGDCLDEYNETFDYTNREFCETCDETHDRDEGCPMARTECVQESGCELCGKEREDQLVGCCEGRKDGERCTKRVETICSDCGVWDEDASEWRCPECAE